MIDFIMTIVREFSHFAFDVGLVLPCWDIVADSMGVCR